MFGYPAAVRARQNLFAGLFQEPDVRPASPRRDRGHPRPRPTGAIAFEPMPGRPMKAYAVVPDAVLIDEEGSGRSCVGEGAELHSRAWPPKEKKKEPVSRKDLTLRASAV